eukprot:CAMPEP_0197177422 /NCGR_PEP_ID=MMETSP1423-20130617/3034_1 /TAXON_ID=476441 /ORGANISM="Pseudo-nitzschia heimii, Strain UNC1101" /LENGTH=79 /DNA_ID=CAMNT_0042626963 /DNA_START=277 /DNA_END=513 /DNA_ORIENTATION=-
MTTLRQGSTSATISFSQNCLVPIDNTPLFNFADFSNFTTNFNNMEETDDNLPNEVEFIATWKQAPWKEPRDVFHVEGLF